MSTTNVETLRVVDDGLVDKCLKAYFRNDSAADQPSSDVGMYKYDNSTYVTLENKQGVLACYKVGAKRITRVEVPAAIAAL